MNETETLRHTFRPERITTLFIGESAPVGGSFFYKGDSQFYRYMRDALKGGVDFLNTFKSEGFFLDDLVLNPCNHRTRKERIQLHREWIPSLAARIANYKPATVVSVMKAIRLSVEQAIEQSQIENLQHFNVSFPGNGQQTKFKQELGAVLGSLPRLKV